MKEPLLNDFATFLGIAFALTFIFLLPSITFALMDCPSHRSLIPIQCSKNKNLKTKIRRITNPFSSAFIYKKTDERETGRERRETKKIKIKIRPSQFQMAITFDRKLRLRRSTRPRKVTMRSTKLTAIAVTIIFGAKKLRLQAQKRI
jgi:hypothetical protein